MGPLVPSDQLECGNSIFFFSLLSHAVVPHNPVGMAAETVAVACNQNAEGWKPSCAIDKLPLYSFPLFPSTV